MPTIDPHPNLEILQEEYLLIEAWKKTVSHLRAHNWFADTLEIDRATVELPQFLKSLARRLSDPGGFETRPLRLVAAPKSHRWIFTDSDDGVKWQPVVEGKESAPRVRPLAHVDLGDQVAATAVMLCLADRVESEQSNPVGSLADENHRLGVLSYGNRLLCDVYGDRLRHRWGSRALYRGFFEDYRTFLSRPSVVASSAFADGAHIAIVQSDLRNFYDRVNPALLARKIGALKRESEPREFFDLAEEVLTWRWDARDEGSVNVYSKRENIPDFSEVALPQGLASAGFFANVVLLDFDQRLRNSFSEEIFSGAYLEDAARYVDDLRIVLRLDSELELADIEHETSTWLDSLLSEEPGVEVSREKTQAVYFGVQVDRPTVRQSDRMTRIQNAVSGGFDVAGGEGILEAVRGLMQTQQRHPQKPDAAGWPLSPVADVPDATVARFAAGRFRRAYRWLRPLAEEPETSLRDSGEGDAGWAESAPVATPRERTRDELDNDAEVFAAGLIQTWVEDPSNIRLLRVALDIWPSALALKRVLALLKPYVGSKSDSESHQIAQYCLAELLRAGATETGLVEDSEVLPLNLTGYHVTLQELAEWVAEHEEGEIPWHLRQQAMLFLAARGSNPLSAAIGRDREISHYSALLQFLSDPNSASSGSDFATYSVLARRSFVPSLAARMLLPHINRSRLTKIASADPALAVELVDLDPRLADFLPAHVRRDLCLVRTLPDEIYSLADLVLKGENPFRDELALLQFAAKVLKILGRGQSGTVAPIDLEVVVHDPDPWAIREGNFDLNLRYRRRVKSSIYSPPSWCPVDERWRFQLGYLLRFILAGNAAFTDSVRSTSWRESQGSSYRPAPMPWSMRRYGFFNAHEAFGDRWLPITEWTTDLLLDLLAWPGAQRPNRPWITQGIDQTSDAIKERIQEILDLQGNGRSELMLRISMSPPVRIKQDRPLRGAVVQTVLPEESSFRFGNETLNANERKLLRRHLTAALAAIRSSLRLRGTHLNGDVGPDLLVLPELSVHADDLGILKAFAIAHKTIILAGLVYHEARSGDGLPLVNSAVWLLPERTALGGHSVRVVDQGKSHLAPEETRAGLNVRPFRSGQWLIGYPWSADSQDQQLWLTASVCYDATDLGLVADLKGRSDVYVIPARNQDVPTFDKMALALHYHMFQMVIVANNGEFGGSNAYVPYKDRFKRQVFHFHGQPQAAIAFLEIDPIREFLNRVQNALGPKKCRNYKSPPAGLES